MTKLTVLSTLTTILFSAHAHAFLSRSCEVVGQPNAFITFHSGTFSVPGVATLNIDFDSSKSTLTGQPNFRSIAEDSSGRTFVSEDGNISVTIEASAGASVFDRARLPNVLVNVRSEKGSLQALCSK